MGENDWGNILWENFAEVKIFHKNQMDLMDNILSYIGDFLKAKTTFEKTIDRLNKTALDNLNKSRRLGLDDNTLVKFTENMISTTGEISNHSKVMLESVRVCLEETQKSKEEFAFESKKAQDAYEKSLRANTQLKLQVNSARKIVLNKKLELETCQKQMCLLDKSEINKYRKLQAQLKDRKKGVDKSVASYNKLKNKLLSFSRKHYQEIVHSSLCTFEKIENDQHNSISIILERFSRENVSLYETCAEEFKEFYSNYSQIDRSKDLGEIVNKFSSKSPLPQEEHIDSISLEDIKANSVLTFEQEKQNGENKNVTENNHVPMRSLSTNLKKSTSDENKSNISLNDKEETRETILNKNDFKKGKLAKKSHSVVNYEVNTDNQNLGPSTPEKVSNRIEPMPVSPKKNYLKSQSLSGNDVVTDCSNASLQERDTKLASGDEALSHRISYSGKSQELSEQSSPIDQGESDLTPAKVLYAYEAKSEIELSLVLGEEVKIISPDSGNGWTYVCKLHDFNQQGYVPTRYIQNE